MASVSPVFYHHLVAQRPMGREFKSPWFKYEAGDEHPYQNNLHAEPLQQFCITNKYCKKSRGTFPTAFL